MNSFSVLIGGSAGYGIDRSSLILAHILNQLGYRLYIYRDYPSLIRGGHTFSIIRAAKERINAHSNKVDFLLALNQDTFDSHAEKLNDKAIVLFDPDSVKAEGLDVPITKIIREEKAAEITRNTCIIGAFCKAAGIGWEILEKEIKANMPKETEINLKVARRGYDAVKELVKIDSLPQPALPILSGNEALSLGLIKGGLKTYVGYPMTPSSTILHFMAEAADEFSLKVVQPESEIGVILMALGFSYAGEKVAVGTSGGGFCLMTEGVSFSGMAELPLVIIVGQRTGPSTGLPTYTGQTELHFVLNAGQGEFPRFMVAPGDPEEAYYWATFALNLAWKYQIPSFILTDKTMAEGGFNFDINSIQDIEEEPPLLWDRKQPYKRYQVTETGVSPLALVPDKDAVIKINSYEHDEAGITIENEKITAMMQEKRQLKGPALAKELDQYETVKVYGKKSAPTAILCWGSNKGVCVELSDKLGLKVIYPLVLSPFPVKQFQKALKGVKKLISVENNATGQLIKLIKMHGFEVDEKIFKYDGRPFALDELEERLKRVLK